MQIHLKGNEQKVKLTKTEQRQLETATNILRNLAKFDDGEDVTTASVALIAIRKRYETQ